MRSLARGGRLVTCGATTGCHVGIDLRALFAKQLSLLGSYVGTKGELLHVARLFFTGRLGAGDRPTFPLAQAADAQRRMRGSPVISVKIVLEV